MSATAFEISDYRLMQQAQIARGIRGSWDCAKHRVSLAFSAEVWSEASSEKISPFTVQSRARRIVIPALFHTLSKPSSDHGACQASGRGWTLYMQPSCYVSGFKGRKGDGGAQSHSSAPHLQKARAFSNRSQSSLDLGCHVATGACEIQILSPLRDYRFVFAVQSRMDACSRRKRRARQKIDSRNMRAPRHSTQYAYPPRRPWSRPQRQNHQTVAHRHGCHIIVFKAKGKQRQPILRGSVQNHEVWPRISGQVSKLRARQRILQALLREVQQSPLAFGDCILHTSRCSLPKGSRSHRKKTESNGSSICKNTTTFSKWKTNRQRATQGCLDQPTRKQERI